MQATQRDASTAYFVFVVAILLVFFLYLGWRLGATAGGDGADGARAHAGLGAAYSSGDALSDDPPGGLALVPADRPDPAPPPRDIDGAPAPDRPAPGADDPDPLLPRPPEPSAVAGSGDEAAKTKAAAAKAGSGDAPDGGAVAQTVDGQDPRVEAEKTASPTAASTATASGSDDTDRAPAVRVERDAPATVGYIVQPGDTLTGIARRHLGSSRRHREIARLNRDVLPDPDRLRPGMRLRLPAPEDGAGGERVKTYRVRDRAESLFSLAARFYGTPKAEALLRKANRDVLAGAEDVRPGMVIRLPESGAFRPEERRSYTVRTGDTLSEIAGRVYNDPTEWRRIRDANPGVITDETSLPVGAKLIIPPR